MYFNKKLLPEIVLVNTQLPENLGATARSMLNFQFERLRVINPKFSLDNEKIIPVCAGADKVIKKIKVFEKFSDSIKDFNYVIATSNRVRSQKKNEISFRKLKEIISKNFKVAIVFGPEKSGLDNEDLSLCDYTIKINSNQKFSSLNLSHAVAIVCYNLYTLLLKKGESNKEKLIENVAKKNELLSFYKILEETLDTSNFFNVKERKKITFQKIKNIFCKYKMSSEEVRTLISIFKKIK
jgi:tRNA/rRNA methyltransferase